MTLSKKQQEIEQIAKEISQLNKTFGGERNRNSFGAFGEETGANPRRDSTYEEALKPQKIQNTSGILTDLSRLLKSFE